MGILITVLGFLLYGGVFAGFSYLVKNDECADYIKEMYSQDHHEFEN